MSYTPNRIGNEWTDATWDVVSGCSHVGPGCRNCYAQLRAGTLFRAQDVPLYRQVTDQVSGKPVFNGRLNTLAPGHQEWTFPLRWRGARHPVLGDGRKSLIFVGNLSDVFHEARPTTTIDRIVDTIAMSRHVGQFLSRRTNRMAEYFAAPRPKRWQRRMWLGFSAERQPEFDRHWAAMRTLPESGWTTFVSIAPMLGPVILPQDFLRHRGRVWVIVSGEQGKGARHMHPDWARAVRDQCSEASVPIFLKQMAGLQPIPADLFVRQFPTSAGIGPE